MIIKPGMDTRDVLACFEAERQALALMDQPSIARVVDASATESGRPYFVLELFKGIPIVDYCEEQEFTTRERLELFLSVCQAIQHAHQNYSRLPIAAPGNLVASAGVVGNTVQGGQRLRLVI
jgi:non-specific serine/threonine protein kinase/serine/threonine-protein kinase